MLKVDAFPWAEFPHRVGIHYNCNSLRGIGLAQASEVNKPFYSKPLDLLKKVKGIEFVQPDRWDECCGFGGTFCIFEPGVSAKMGTTRSATMPRQAPNHSRRPGRPLADGCHGPAWLPLARRERFVIRLDAALKPAFDPACAITLDCFLEHGPHVCLCEGFGQEIDRARLLTRCSRAASDLAVEAAR